MDRNNNESGGIMFCTQCEKEVVTCKKTSMEQLVIHGIELEVEQVNRYCEDCGEIVFDKDLDALNATKVKEEYSKKTGVITSLQIREDILDKYGIGASSLGKLLGWGESTIQRYLDGAIPKVEYGKKLIEILDPLYMEEMLCKNKNRISKRVLENVLKKVEEAYENSNEKKGHYLINPIDLVKYFVSKCEDMDEIAPTKAWCLKMVSLCQYWHLTYFGVPLFKEKVFAWQYGPIVKEVYFDMNRWGSKIPSPEYVEESIGVSLDISEEQKELIDLIFESYGKFQATLLIKVTHDAMWEKYYIDGDLSSEIPKWDIKCYYDNLRELMDIKNLNDLRIVADFQIDKAFRQRGL